MSFAIWRWRLAAAAALVLTLAVSGVWPTSERVEGTVAGMNGIIASQFTAPIPPPINNQHSACLAEVTTSGTTVTINNACYNVTKTGPSTPPVPPPPPPPYASLAAPGVRTTLSGPMNPTTGEVTLGFAGNPCLPADSDNDTVVDDGVTVQVTSTVKNDMMLAGTIHLEFFLNDLTCSGTPSSTAEDPFTPTNLADDHDGDIDDPNVSGTQGPDGCTTSQELGTNQAMGGMRDPWNPWDYFNPSQDGRNRVDDIIAVVQHFGQDEGVPGSTYDTRYDRTALVGGNLWQFDAPNGTIRVTDITAAVRSFGHDCV